MKTHTHSLLAKILLVFFILSMSSCAYSQEKETRRISDFDAIHVGQGINVYLTQDKAYFVEIESEVDLDDVETEVRGGKLYISIDKGMWSLIWNKEVNVDVHLPELVEVDCSGGADVIGRSAFVGDEIKIFCSGGADVKMEVKYDKITLDCSGGADTRLMGEAGTIDANVSGGSDLHAFDLRVSKAYLDCSGGGDIDIRVTEMIKANASGGADINYSGDPEVVDVQSSGGGDVSKR